MKDEDPVRHNKRLQIIEAAVKEFQEKGFFAASMDQISNRASVSKRTLYKYFESKDNLFRSIIAELSDRISVTMALEYDPALDIRTQLTNLAMAEGTLLTSPEFMGMCRMLIGESFRSPELVASMQVKIDKTSSVIAFLKAADAHGTLQVEKPEAAAEEFLALIKSKAFWPVVFGADVVSQSEMDDIIQGCVEMMLARYASG